MEKSGLKRKGALACFFGFFRNNSKPGRIVMSGKDVETGAGFDRHNRMTVSDWNEIEEAEKVTRARCPQ